MVVKRGRPAKAGERYPSGDLKRRPGEQHHAVLPRVRELFRVAQGYNAVKALALDPRMSPDYAPGQLFLLGLVNAGELEDGARIARIYGRFERLHGRRRSSTSPDYRSGRGGGPEPDDEDAAAIEEDFALLRDALMAHGASALAALEQFWVEGRHIDARALREVLRVTAAARRRCDKARKRRKLGAADAGRGRTAHDTPPPAPGERGTSGAAAARSQPAARRSATYDRHAWAMLARAINPAIDAHKIDAAWDAFTALKERERFRRDKARGRT
jgi:hypothetical protein